MGIYINRDKLLIRIKNIYSDVDGMPPRVLLSSILMDIEDSDTLNADMKTAYDNGFEAGVKSTVRHYTGEMDPKEMARQFQELSEKHFGEAR